MNKTAWERLLAGWPVYSAVAVFLFAFSQLWVKAQIQEGIKAQTGQVAEITAMAQSLALTSLATTHNTSLINDVSAEVKIVEADTKAILLHLAGD